MRSSTCTARSGICPIGTRTNPGVKSCISTSTLECLASPYNEIHGDTLPFSFTLEVTSPIEVVLHLVAAGEDTLLGYGTKMQVDIGYPDADHVQPGQNPFAPAHIEKRLAVGVEPDTAGANSNVVYLDTDFGTIGADVRIFKDGDLSTEINAPMNTRAQDRYVEIENEGVLEGRNNGYLMCPSGFTAHAYSFPNGSRYNLNDDVCTRPMLTGTSSSTVPADGLPHIVGLFGTSFASATEDRVTGGYLEGSHLLHLDLLRPLQDDHVMGRCVLHECHRHHSCRNAARGVPDHHGTRHRHGGQRFKPAGVRLLHHRH